MKKVGRKTELTKETLAKIKESVMGGETLKDIAKIINVSESTIYHWNCNNYANLADKIEGWRRDRKLKLAEDKIEDILELSISDKDTIKVQADIAKFTAETLGKDIYSKRTETTGKNGKDLPTPILYAVQDNNSDNKDNEVEEEDKSNSRGDFSEQDDIDINIFDSLSSDG